MGSNRIPLNMAHFHDTWKSKKLWFSAFCVAVLFVAAVVGNWIPSVLTVYATLAGSVVAIVGALLAANVMNKNVAVKAQAVVDPVESDPKPPHTTL